MVSIGIINGLVFIYHTEIKMDNIISHCSSLYRMSSFETAKLQGGIIQVIYNKKEKFRDLFENF